MDKENSLPAPYGVYVQTDAEGRITAINSDAFLTDLDGWTHIDDGEDDRCHHAQGNYLPLPLTDERGLYRYKLVDGVPAERTADELDADFAALPEPEQSTEDLLLEMAGDHEYRLCLIELGLTESDLMDETESEVI